MNVGIELPYVLHIDDEQHTVAFNARFFLRWTDKRIIIQDKEFQSLLLKGIICQYYFSRQVFCMYFVLNSIFLDASMYICKGGSKFNNALSIDGRFTSKLWQPDIEIQRLKEFKPLSILSKVIINVVVHSPIIIIISRALSKYPHCSWKVLG